MTALRRSALLLLAVALSAATACGSVDAPGTAGVVGTGEPASVETGVGDPTGNQSEPINQVTENTASIPPYEDTIVGEWVKIRVDHHLLTETVLVFHPDGRYEISVVFTDLSRLATETWDADRDTVAGFENRSETGTYVLYEAGEYPWRVKEGSSKINFISNDKNERSWQEYFLEDGQLTLYYRDDDFYTHGTFTREAPDRPLISSIPLDSLPTQPTDTNIVGTWQYTKISGNSVDELIFHPDGRYDARTIHERDAMINPNGSWSTNIKTGMYFIEGENGIQRIKLVAVNGWHWPYVNDAYVRVGDGPYFPYDSDIQIPAYEWHNYKVEENRLVITTVFDGSPYQQTIYERVQ